MDARSRQVRALGTRGRELDEKVHDARTTIKRLRALWRLARPSMSEADFQRENRRLRDAKHHLEGMRNLRVIHDTLQRMTDMADEVTAAEVARLARRLEAPTRTAGEAREIRSALPAVMREVDRSIRAFRALEFDGDEWIRAGLQRSFRRARKAGRLEPDSPDEAVHLWRRRVKVLFYHLEALEPYRRKGVARLRQGLDTLQERLGEDHDLVMLVSGIDQRVGPRDAAVARKVKDAARRRSRKLRR